LVIETSLHHDARLEKHRITLCTVYLLYTQTHCMTSYGIADITVLIFVRCTMSLL